ncbi:MAG: ABC transporter ATP-binding protein [Halolamina sp.]
MSSHDSPERTAGTTEPSGETAGDVDADVDDSDSTPPELEGRELSLAYEPGEPVVELDRLVIPAGEVTALVGPNGSGKSTLLKAMNAELSSENGTMYFDGRDVEAYGTTELAKQLGLLSQHNSAPASTTVRDLAAHGRYPHRGFFEPLSEADHHAIDRALERVGVEELADREVGSLSGGQRQLAWLAMTFAQETDALLLDEPTTFLDLHHQLRVLRAARELNEERGVTVCVVLHDIGQAARFADNLIALKEGTPYEWGPPDEVVTPELLADVFGVEAEVGFGPEGPTIVPREPVDKD